MNSPRLIARNIVHFRASAIAVVAGMAVATAVLTGALMVGDSVRGSLAELTLQRLGKTDYALAAMRFFDDSQNDSLARRIAGASGIASQFEVVPALIVTGGAATGEDANRRRTGGGQIGAIGGDWIPVAAGSCVLNSETADA